MAICETIRSNETQIKEVLDVFDPYLKKQQHVEFVWTEKFGLLYMTLWNRPTNLYTNSAFDVVQISSVEELCEALIDLLVYDYLFRKQQLCFDDREIDALYTEMIEPYITRLPKYKEILHNKFEKVLIPIRCKKEN